jgi:hypothetical protein
MDKDELKDYKPHHHNGYEQLAPITGKEIFYAVLSQRSEVARHVDGMFSVETPEFMLFFDKDFDKLYDLINRGCELGTAEGITVAHPDGRGVVAGIFKRRIPDENDNAAVVELVSGIVMALALVLDIPELQKERR